LFKSPPPFPPPACFRQQTALQIGERRGSLGSVWKQEARNKKQDPSLEARVKYSGRFI